MIARIALIIALVLASTLARSDGIYNPSSFGVGFTDGIFNGGSVAVIPSCASPTAPNGVIDLSLCSNASYAAVIF